jgi:hypothetical protein
MEFANIESLDFVLPFGSAVMVTSVGTPKRYATDAELELLSGCCELQKKSTTRELFGIVTKSELTCGGSSANT